MHEKYVSKIRECLAALKDIELSLPHDVFDVVLEKSFVESHSKMSDIAIELYRTVMDITNHLYSLFPKVEETESPNVLYLSSFYNHFIILSRSIAEILGERTPIGFAINKANLLGMDFGSIEDRMNIMTVMLIELHKQLKFNIIHLTDEFTKIIIFMETNKHFFEFQHFSPNSGAMFS